MADAATDAPNPTTPATVPSIVDIPGIIREGLKNVQEGIRQAAGAAGAAASLGAESQKNAEAAANQKATATKELNAATAAQEVELLQKNRESQAMLGNLPGAQSRVLTELGTSVIDKLPKLKELQDDIEQRKSVGFFDDPMQFIANGFVTPMKEKQLGQVEHDIESRLGIIKAVQERTTEAAKNNASTTIVDSEAKKHALDQIALADATTAIAESQHKLAALSIQGTSLKLATTMDQFSAIMQSDQAQLNFETFQINRANADVTLTNGKIDTEIKKIQLLQINEKESDRREFEDKLKVASAGMGLDITTFAQFDRAPNEMKATLLKVMGTQAALSNGTPGFVPPIAISPARAVDVLQTVGSIGSSPGMAQVVNKINDWKAHVADPNVNATFNMLKPESKFALEDKEIQTKAQSEYKNIPSTGGIYSPNPLRSVVAMNPIIGNLPLIKELVPLALNDQYETKAQDFVTIAKKMVTDGKLSAQDASAQIAATFQAMAVDQNNVRQYGRLALPSMKSSDYTMSVQDAYGRTSTLNMANPAAVQNFIVRSITQEKHKGRADTFSGTTMFLNPGNAPLK